MPASDTSSADEVRILNSISDGKNNARSSAGAAVRKPRRVLAIVLLLLLVAGGVTLAALRMNAHEAASAPVQASSVPPVPPLASATPAATPAPAPGAVSEPAVAPADAAVINDTNAPAPDVAAAPAPRGPDQLTSALEEGVKPPPAALKNALEAKPEKSDKPAKQSAQHDEKKKKSAKADNHNDSDVDLIKALVARSGETDKKHAPKSGNGGSSDAPQKPLPPQASAPRQKEARNVDVVERRNGESTASLLQRCHALGFVEGEFCRWRICSGRWDSDPACKVADANN
ncbi:hypothetical protein HBDW_41180 [Herbaspirillum sp. DW155]|uniref:hypothetical protein n=1 Tax=Herbaspirillum sp. DW155 TaxID=3095609 RepID=UPI00308484BF|nr:hypothetical protein HBDW_41180 [Herbaspirillum sp. DW155]